MDRFTLLYRLAEQIQRARHVDVVYEEALEGLRSVTDADRAGLLVLDGGLMRFVAWSRLSESCRLGIEGFAPWAPDARDPRPVHVPDVGMGEPVEPVRGALLAEGIGALACVPLLHHGRLTGEIILFRDLPGGFEDDDLRVAEAIAGHLAFAIWRNRADADQAKMLRRYETERSLLEAVVRQMPAGVLLADVPSGRIVMSNAQAAVLWGSAQQQASQIRDYGRWGGRSVAGRPLAPEEWPLARAVLHGETVRGEDIEIERSDGSRMIIRMSAAPVLDGQTRQIAAVATLYDVTGERTQEARHALIEEATRALNASLDMELTLGELSRLVVGPYADWCAVHRRVGPERIERVALAHADPARAEAVAAVIPESLREDSEHVVATVIRDRRPVMAVRPAQALAALWADVPEPRPRSLAPTSALVLPLMARERALGSLVLARTQGRYSEEEIALLGEVATRAGLAMDNVTLYEQATAADRAKANFLAVMSHEFRTPLSAILGYADILTEEVHGDLTSKQRAHLDRVKASVRHLSHLVDEILSFASMEAGRERVRVEAVELGAVVRDVAGIMEPIAEAAGLELRVVAPDEAVTLDSDASKLRQILINLVSNAIKYTPEGHVDLVLETDGDRVYCLVADTGPGIAAEHRETVFEPFWQIEQAGGRRISGTGLGLAVARRLARLLGGDVDLESELGDGSRFTLDLPRAQPAGVAVTHGA